MKVEEAKALLDKTSCEEAKALLDKASCEEVHYLLIEYLTHDNGIDHQTLIVGGSQIPISDAELVGMAIEGMKDFPECRAVVYVMDYLGVSTPAEFDYVLTHRITDNINILYCNREAFVRAHKRMLKKKRKGYIQ